MNDPTLNISDETGQETLEVIAKATKFNYWMFRNIQPYLKGEVLEIGSGIGNISHFLVERNYPVTLSDYNPYYKELLTKKFKNTPCVKAVWQIDLQDKNFTHTYHSLKESFDTVFLLNVIEHLENDQEAISNCHFLLKNGGNLVLLAPAYSFLYCRFDKELGHFRRYTVNEMADKMQSRGFRVISKKYFNFAGIFGWLIFGKLFGRKKIEGKEMSAFNFLVPVARIADRIIFHQAGLSVIACGQKVKI